MNASLKHELLGGSGGIPPQKRFDFTFSKIDSKAIFESNFI